MISMVEQGNKAGHIKDTRYLLVKGYIRCVGWREEINKYRMIQLSKAYLLSAVSIRHLFGVAYVCST